MVPETGRKDIRKEKYAGSSEGDGGPLPRLKRL